MKRSGNRSRKRRDPSTELTEGTEAVAAGLRARVASNGKLTTFRGQGLQPGVDLDDTAALLALMEGDRDSELRKRFPRESDLAKRS
jgi:hypothetical protein